MGILVEPLYRFWLYLGKFMAWRVRRAKDHEPEYREYWVHRHQAAEGYLGTETRCRPTARIFRLLELLTWYSPLGQLIVWRTKKGDW